MIALLGPTATGKTALAARLAYELNGEVISADSRQVYRGMDIGTGKDLCDYLIDGILISYHLIDIAEPGYEYNIFEYQKDFLNAYTDILDRKKMPVLCGGSGMYLEAVLKGYRLTPAYNNSEFLKTLEDKSYDQLVDILKSYKTLHNVTDLEDRPRLMKAILVASRSKIAEDSRANPTFPEITSLVFGISYPRDLLRLRIAERLESRLNNGMIAEVERLLQGNISPERLMKYGLEYKFVTLFLKGELSRSDMFLQLNTAICQFAKRQMTWFRRMERQGMAIHWIDGQMPVKKKAEEIMSMVRRFI